MSKKNEDFDSLGFPTKEMYLFPSIVNIEVFRGSCPCHCRHCPVGTTPLSKRRERFGNNEIDLRLYENIVNEIAEYPTSFLRVHGTGEPLLWNNLAKALKLAHDRSVRSWLFTCAVTDNIPLLEEVCRNTSIVEVSVNSISSEDYRATKGFDAFERVVENIKYMHGFIESDRILTRLVASRVESLDKAADEEFVRYWKSSGLVDDAFVRSYHTYNDVLDKLSNSGENSKHVPCLVHWARFNISVEGNAVVCFNELFKQKLNPSLILGCLKDQTIAEIWHGPKLTAIRKAELAGDYSDLSSKNVLPCINCYSCQPLFGSGQTSEYQINKLPASHDK